MPKASIIIEIAKRKHKSIGWIEKELGYANAGLRKAIERDNDLKIDKIDRLMSLFPDLNRKWIETQQGEMFVEKSDMRTEVDADYQNDSEIGRTLRIIEEQQKINAQLANTLAEQAKALTDIIQSNLNFLSLSIEAILKKQILSLKISELHYHRSEKVPLDKIEAITNKVIAELEGVSEVSDTHHA